MGKKILTADDSKVVRMIVTNTFQPYDCTIVSAVDGADAVEVALRERPDLIFMDITMPNLTGIEALEKIRQTPEIANTHVVMLTAESDGQRLGMADKLKVSGYIAKPFKPEQLIELTRTIIPLPLKGGGGAPATGTPAPGGTPSPAARPAGASPGAAAPRPAPGPAPAPRPAPAPAPRPAPAPAPRPAPAPAPKPPTP